jgi:hypothetical protein
VETFAQPGTRDPQTLREQALIGQTFVFTGFFQFADE